jgi:exonuclease III
MYNVYIPDIIAIQETKIDRNILTSELFLDSFNYDVYRNDRTLNGGGVILLVNKTYNSMPLYNLENGSESVWAKIMFDGSPLFLAAGIKTMRARRITYNFSTINLLKLEV